MDPPPSAHRPNVMPLHRSLPLAPLCITAALTGALAGPAAGARPQQATAAGGSAARPNAPSVALGRYALSTHPVLWAEGSLGPVEIDRANGGSGAGDGGALTVQGATFARGFGARASSAIAIELGRRAALFRCAVGIDDQGGNSGTARFQILGDGVVLWDSGLRTGAQPALDSGLVDVRGVTELVLLARDGDDGFANDYVDWCEPTILATAPPTANDAALRARRGKFASSGPWPVTAMHAAVLPDGRLVTHASASATSAGDPSTAAPHDTTRVDVWDQGTNTHVAVDHPTSELIGATAGRLPDGRPVTFGGFAGRVTDVAVATGDVSAFGPTVDGWLPLEPLAAPRYGAGVLTLGDGSSLVFEGQHQPGTTHRPERAGPVGRGLLDGVNTQSFDAVGDADLDHTFPWVHLAPDGRVLRAGWDERMQLVDTRGSGTVDYDAPRESLQRAWGASAQVRGDQVVLVGGVDHRGDPTRQATRTALRIDVAGSTPSTSSAGSLVFRRADHDATILADGTLLVTGGARQHASAATVQVAELYDPVTNTWSLADRAARPRGYRSTAVLMPDGRVWVGGGDPAGPSAEFYFPPYLFRANGIGATRPQIASAPERVAFGETFQVITSGPAPITRVTLLGLGASTHGTNAGQRFLELSFSAAGGGVLNIDAPLRGNDAPPGTYMLFCIDANGVPSVARMVTVGFARPSTWSFLPALGGPSIVARHETAAVEVAGKLYLIGGRGSRPTQEYDLGSRTWRSLAPTPFEMHHFQPVVLDGKVYVVGAFTGPYPNESNVANIWIFDPADESWTQGAALPAGRERGSAGAVVHDGRFYLVGGNNQGHNGGARPWFDVYDPQSNTWTSLPDAPRARDHFLAAVIGNRLVLAGGRTTTQPNPFTGTIAEVDAYDFESGTWSTLDADIPTQRAGTMAVAEGRYLVVAGGESASQFPAHPQVEALDVLNETWVALPGLIQGRHSGGIASHDGRAYVISGSGNQGGSPELTTAEVIDLPTALSNAPATNTVVNGGFDEGTFGWQTTGDVKLVREHGVRAPGLGIAAGSASGAAPATPGTTYRFRLLYTSTSGSGTVTLRTTYYDGGGASLGTSSAALGVTGTSPRLGEHVSAAPAGSVRVSIEVTATGQRTAVIDDVSITAL